MVDGRAMSHLRGLGMLNPIRLSQMKLQPCVLLLIALPLAAAPLPQIVASDDLGTPGKQAHLLAGSPWTWQDRDGLADKTVAFGENVVLSYDGANPAAKYEITLSFSSDSPDRVVEVRADDTLLAQRIEIPNDREISMTFPIPPAVTADGRFELQVRKLAGPNAALASAVVRSDNPGLLGFALPDFGLDEITLTPLPLSSKAGPQWSQSLDGRWKFSPQAPAQPGKVNNAAASSWPDIEVPGQWRNQDHEIDPNQATCYFREFTIPPDWAGRRVKLRFDAVFSDCTVFVNGMEVGDHLGGFTPFEVDLTKQVQPGTNRLALQVTSMSLADQMASASKYACHPLGGISRSVTLFSVPKIHLSDLYLRTDFDDAFRDAVLRVEVEIDARGADGPGETIVRCQLWDPDSREVSLKNPSAKIRWTKPGKIRKTIEFPVAKARWWTPETPELYLLEVVTDEHLVRQRVGFREIEVRGAQLLVNGQPVKLRGSNRHEADPLRGRSLPQGQWRKDVALFRDANVNLLRTCHYPPDHALVEASDELGMWVEMEGPFCWEGGSSDPSHRAATVRQLAEMVLRDRNNPSVLFWSLANESQWGSNFAIASRVMRQLDPTRPQTFNWMSTSLNVTDAGFCEIGNIHYPGMGGAEQAKDYGKRPLDFGEFSHLNAYNRRELMTDPGLRDRWGVYFERMWETMWQEPNCLGGAIWSGIDDTFFLGDDLTVGYGAWGPIDGWRRPKPEWWHVKKTYSPVHLTHRNLPVYDHGAVVLQLENRHDFLDFDQLAIRWEMGPHKGETKASLPARQQGVVMIESVPVPQPGEVLTIRFTDPRGVELNRFAFPIGGNAPAKIDLPAPELRESGKAIHVRQGEMIFRIDRRTGAVSASHGKNPVLTGGPQLMVLALNNEGNTQMTGATKHFEAFTSVCGGWQCEDVTIEHSPGGGLAVVVAGRYDEAEGSFRWNFAAGQRPEFRYDFTIKKAVNPRQIGVVFDLPKGFDRLIWQRSGQWTTYPADHIGRLEGVALAKSPHALAATEIGPRQQPGKGSTWSSDHTRYGSNDFRSTKETIRHGHVSSGPDRPGLALFPADPEAPLHLRAWIDPANGITRILAASYTNGGAERFLRRLSKSDDQALKKGDTVSGRFKLMLR